MTNKKYNGSLLKDEEEDDDEDLLEEEDLLPKSEVTTHTHTSNPLVTPPTTLKLFLLLFLRMSYSWLWISSCI